MTSNVDEARPPGKAIYQLVVEARDSDKKEQRTDVRYPFFRPVTIEVDGKRYSAFSRDISAFGIGLLHNIKLTPGQVELSIESQHGYSIRVATQIVWCWPCGEGWYVSGGQFVSIAGVGV